jgi:hypothetical protein
MGDMYDGVKRNWNSRGSEKDVFVGRVTTMSGCGIKDVLVSVIGQYRDPSPRRRGLRKHAGRLFLAELPCFENSRNPK